MVKDSGMDSGSDRGKNTYRENGKFLFNGENIFGILNYVSECCIVHGKNEKKQRNSEE